MKILIVDDHALVRSGLKEALGELCGEPPEYVEAENADQVRGIIASRVRLDLVLLDLYLPGAEGFDLVSEVCANDQGVPVVVLSASESVEDMNKARDCGASGYLTKSTAFSLMRQALRLVLAGGVYIPPDVLKTSAIETPSTAAPEPAGAATNRLPNAETNSGPQQLVKLTPRQLEVLALMCKGCSNKVIARQLELSEFTVKAHVAAIFRALDVSSRMEAALVARQEGFPPG